jgi:hypothetical protein
MLLRVAILLLASVAVLAVLGYLGAGLIYAKVRLDAADSALNTSVADQVGLAPLINAFKGGSAPAAAATLSAAELQHDRDVLAKFVTGSESGASQIEVDDQSLADAAAGLAEDRWLTPLSVAAFDNASRRIAVERNVLADARPIITDYVQIGGFFQSFADVEIDFYAISASSQAHNLNAVESEIAQVASDIAKARSFDKAPGLPPEVDTLMSLIQVIGEDFSNLLNAALAHNASAFTSAEKSGRADIARLQAFDTHKIVAKVEAFYAPMIEAYNSDAAKARAA